MLKSVADVVQNSLREFNHRSTVCLQNYTCAFTIFRYRSIYSSGNYEIGSNIRSGGFYASPRSIEHRNTSQAVISNSSWENSWDMITDQQQACVDHALRGHNIVVLGRVSTKNE